MNAITLCGTSHALTDGVLKYSELRSVYSALADQNSNDFKKTFRSLFASLDALVYRWEKVVDEIISEPIELAMTQLVGLDIYDISKSDFVSEFYSKYNISHKALEWITDQRDDLMSEYIAKAEQIDARGGGGGIIGGGFGIEGAAQGMAVATAANLAIGAVQGISKHVSSSVNANAAVIRKKLIFESEETISYLANSIYELIYSIHLAILDAVAAKVAGEVLFCPPTKEAVSRARGIYENCKAGRIPLSKQNQHLASSLFLNPFDAEVYSYWLEYLGDENKELERFYLVHNLGALAQSKREIIVKFLEKADQSSVKTCDELCLAVQEKSRFLGVSVLDLLASVKKTRDRYEVLERTYDGVVYESIAALEAAKQEASMTLAGVTYANDEELEAAKKELARRTVDNVVYATYQEAIVAKKHAYSNAAKGLAIFLSPLPNIFFAFSFKTLGVVFSVIWLLVFYGYIFPIDLNNPFKVLAPTLMLGIAIMFVRISSSRQNDAQVKIAIEKANNLDVRKVSGVFYETIEEAIIAQDELDSRTANGGVVYQTVREATLAKNSADLMAKNDWYKQVAAFIAPLPNIIFVFSRNPATAFLLLTWATIVHFSIFNIPLDALTNESIMILTLSMVWGVIVMIGRLVISARNNKNLLRQESERLNS